MVEGIGIADAIDSLREELSVAIYRAKGKQMRFQLDPVEVELQAVVTSVGEGKVGWKIVELGGSYTRGATHTVKLTLRPEWRSEVGGQYDTDFRVSGTVSPAPEADVSEDSPAPAAGRPAALIDEVIEEG